MARQDLRRIAREGPTIDDLRQEQTIFVEDEKGNEVEEDIDFIPPTILGDTAYDYEVHWQSLPRLSYMEFYRGLQERNWTSKIYNPRAEPWKLQFFSDSGRLLRPSYAGFRVLIERPDKSQCWVNLPKPGNRTFIEDLIAPREAGSIVEAPRRDTLTGLDQFGYNQVGMDARNWQK